MKLLLASSLDKTIALLSKRLSRNSKNVKVLFIANAADPYDTDKFWIKLDRDAFMKLGYQMDAIDLRKVSPKQFAEHLKNADVLHMCGGSVLYLISLLRERGLESILVDAVKNDQIFYSATSAGSMITSNRLDLCAYDQEELSFVKGIKDFSGLGLVKFLIIPHCNQAIFIENHKIIIEHLPRHPQPLIFLQDNQAVWVENNKFDILFA